MTDLAQRLAQRQSDLRFVVYQKYVEHFVMIPLWLSSPNGERRCWRRDSCKASGFLLRDELSGCASKTHLDSRLQIRAGTMSIKREIHSNLRNCLRREREGCGFAFRFGNVLARLGYRKVTALAAAIGET